MPQRDGSGPPIHATGPRDGRGKGKGFHARAGEPGSGKKTGGNKGECT